MTSRETKLSTAIEKYLADLAKNQSESARAHRFSLLLSEVFSDQPELIEGYSNGIETFLKNTQLGGVLKGRADNVFGSMIIEFEGLLPKKLDEAREQICRYAAIAWSGEDAARRTPYVGLATDGTRFYVYSPISSSNASVLNLKDVSLQLLEERDWTKYAPIDNYFWLDRLFARRERVAPTGERIAADFGVHSHCFQTARREMEELWLALGEQPAFAVVYEAWDKYLRIVYGTSLKEGDLFLRHTYLATLAKVLAWRRLTPSATELSSSEISGLLSGVLFQKRGLQNFLEQDFFSWLSRPEAFGTAKIIVTRIASLLDLYDLEKLSEDVLKTLYQGLVDPSERHYLGEYYTPDWLANRVVNEALDQNANASILDPSCGSGSFLYIAIHEKRKRLGDSPATMRHILDSVCGADIHPLAVIVAKTNYILALGDALQKHRPKGNVSLPVYLADTLKIPETLMQADEYGISVDKRTFPLEKSLAIDPARADFSIELQNRWANEQKAHDIPLADDHTWKERFEKFLHGQGLQFSEEEGETLWRGAKTLHDLLRADRDSIWAYVVKNIYKPLALFDRFDFVLGNPPWIALRFLEPDYQARVKDQSKNSYRLVGASGHLNTQMEIATLFMLRAADLYLKRGGRIGFIVPRSVFSADQHAGLRAGTFRLTRGGNTLAIRELWDLDKVRPLFNVPSCCVWGEKVPLESKPSSKTPIVGREFSGRLLFKNSDWVQAKPHLQETEVEYYLHQKGKRTFWDDSVAGTKSDASVYQRKFDNGATIYPRSFWFVDFLNWDFGIDIERPPVRSSAAVRAESKEPYKDVLVEGTVESQYIYGTLLASELLPFGHFAFRPVILPIVPHEGNYHIFDSVSAKNKGDYELADWMSKVEKIWQLKRGSKSENSTVVEWLNYRNKITNQNPNTQYWVLYNVSGSYLTATKVKKQEIVFNVAGQSVRGQGFIADYKTFYMESHDEDEADYLVAVLNAPIIDELVKPMQSRGLFGPRDICKKVLDLPIPLYDAKNSVHRELVDLARQCATLVVSRIEEEPKLTQMQIGRARTSIRTGLSEQLFRIDTLMKSLMD